RYAAISLSRAATALESIDADRGNTRATYHEWTTGASVPDERSHRRRAAGVDRAPPHHQMPHGSLLEAEARLADLDLVAVDQEALDHALAADEGPAARAEIAQEVAAVRRANHLGVVARHRRIEQHDQTGRVPADGAQ